MQNLFIDRENLDQLDLPRLTRVWSEIPRTENYQIISNEEQVNPNVVATQKFVVKFLNETEGVQNKFDLQKNMMTYMVLRIA
jgi:hypothetical protein